MDKVVNIMQQWGRRRTEEGRRKMGGGARERDGMDWRMRVKTYNGTGHEKPLGKNSP